jgi:DNA polymerase III epsilon subunit family exonuclease
VLEDIPFVAFDTETTGLQVSDRLVELGAVRFCGDRVEAEWSVLVDPGVPIPAAAFAVHGIHDADVAGCVRAAQILPSFLEFIDGAALVGHNAPFDVRVLALELVRAGLRLPDNPVLDTCAIPRRLKVGVANHRLSTLATAFGVRQGRAHRALDDARVAKDLLRAYLRDLGPDAEGLVRRALTEDGLRLSLRQFASDPLPDSPLLALVRRARAEGRGLHLDCGVDRSHVTPRDIYSLGGAVYLEGCVPDGTIRTVRLDGITRARLD